MNYVYYEVMDVRGRLAANLRLLMAATGITTQTAVGRKAGLSQTQVGNILRCEKDATIATLFKLAKALSVEPWQLLAPQSFLIRSVEAEANALLEFYGTADPEDRQAVLRVAETAARHRSSGAQ